MKRLNDILLRLMLFVLCIIAAPLVGGQGALRAQSFPVQVIPQATPPPPIYFSDYADESTVNSPLRVQLILNDFEIANREVRLRTYFEGGGIAFQSNEVVVGASPLFLEGGVPLVLTNVELAPYFRFENISGISPNLYGQAIPEGAYQFCFEVYDVLTGNRLSQKSCVNSVIFQNEPPFLISPRNKTNVEEFNPQNIVFQWTPRHINVSNVEYELSIVEIWDTQVDPQSAFLSSPPVFQATTSTTTYVYGPADPLFLSGKNYAWRVQAKAKQGIEEIGLFENQGYSEIYSFSYASSCDLPLGVNHEVKGSTNANVFWDDFSTEIPEYIVRYRKATGPVQGTENEWFMNKTTTNQTTLWDLKAGTTYEYQIQKKCTVNGSDWSLAKQFTTFIADDEASVYECGITPDFSLSNNEPLPNIGVGDKFTAGDFPITISEVSGSNGRFTGKGYVRIPYLNSIKVSVEFTNVLLNTDKQLAEGTVVTKYDPSMKGILDVDAAIETVTEAVDAVGEFLNEINQLLKDFKGTPEEISLLEELNQKQSNYVDELLSNPHVSQEVKDDIESKLEIYESASNTLIAEASENGPNQDGYGMAEQIIDTNNNLQNSVATAENQVFVGEAFPIVSNDTLFKRAFEDLKKIAEYLEETSALCRKEGWASYSNEGLVPYCIWRDAPISKNSYYSKTDIPYMSGIIDGAFLEVEGLVLLPNLLYDAGNGITDLMFAYTAAYFTCHPELTELNEKRLEGLLAKLEKNKKVDSIWSWAKGQWYNIENLIAETYKNECEDAEKLRKEINELAAYLSEIENIKEIYLSIEEKLIAYFNRLDGSDNQSRYEHGKVVIAVGSSFIPVVGWLSKSVKVKKVLEGIRRFSKGQWDDFFRKIEKKIGETPKVKALTIDEIADNQEIINIAKTVKYLPGPKLPEKIAATFNNLIYTNRKLTDNEKFFKYHGKDNRTGKKYTWLTKNKYKTEKDLREGLAIREDWGVKISRVSEFDVPKGTWVSEGKAASQGVGYPGQDYQAVILNLPKSWLIRTDTPF